MSVPSPLLSRLVEAALDERRAAGRLRALRTIHPVDATHVEIDGRAYVNFCSNNYLGLSTHPRVVEAAQSTIQRTGFGSGSAALICGQTDVHASAAKKIAEWKQTESAVILPSGYQANHAAVQTLAGIGGGKNGRGVRFLVDKLVHASIIDAVSASGGSGGTGGAGATMRVFPHNHLGKLTRLLEGSDGESLDVVITESIFSMDGDAADLRGLVQLKANHPFVLMLDEAHGSGVYGKNGAGYAHECGLHEAVDISIVTFSKALGGIGAAICSSRQFGEAVVNFGRAFIYTTNLPASAAAAAEAAIGVLHDQPERQIRLRKLSRQTREKLTAAGVNMPAGDSPILCVIVGAESAALEAAAWLQKEGLLVSAVRPPTVAPGGSRLRATLCSGHTDEEVKRLIAALIRFGKP